MTQDGWHEVDALFADWFAPSDAVLASTERRRTELGMPNIAVSPAHAKFLYLLGKIVRARRILEIGTLSGYSSIFLARSLDADGELHTIEINPEWAAAARASLDEAGFREPYATIHVGPALDVLPEVAAAGIGPFDLVFLDADKRNNPTYLDWAIRLSRSGTLIVMDNVVRGSTQIGGAILEAGTEQPDVQGTRAALERMATDPRLEATAIQTVGFYGWDGFALARVR